MSPDHPPVELVKERSRVVTFMVGWAVRPVVAALSEAELAELVPVPLMFPVVLRETALPGEVIVELSAIVPVVTLTLPPAFRVPPKVVVPLPAD